MSGNLRFSHSRVLGKDVAGVVPPREVRMPDSSMLNIVALENAATQKAAAKVETAGRVVSALTNHFEALAAFILGTDDAADAVKQAAESLSSSVDERNVASGVGTV